MQRRQKAIGRELQIKTQLSACLERDSQKKSWQVDSQELETVAYTTWNDRTGETHK